MAPKDGGLLFWIGGVSVSDAEKATLADISKDRTGRIGRYQCCGRGLICQNWRVAWNVKPAFAREAQARA